MSTYWQKLKDPRWQKRRLEIMSAAGFECVQCEAKDKPLHVHHKQYLAGREPWEYDDEFLECLCETCHAKITGTDKEIKHLLGLLDEVDKHTVLGFLRAMCTQHGPEYDPCTIDDYETADGAAAFCRIDTDNLIELVRSRGTLARFEIVGIGRAVRNSAPQFTPVEIERAIAERMAKVAAGGFE